MQEIPKSILGRLRFLLFSRSEGHYLLFLCLVWGKGLLIFFRSFIVNNDMLSFLAPVIDALIIWLMFPIAAKSILPHIRTADIIFFIVCTLTYLSQYLFFPENSEILSEYAPIFLISTLPLFFIGIQLDVSKIQIFFRYVSIIVILFGVFYSLIYNQQKNGAIDTNGDEMGMAYLLSPHVMFILWQTIKNFNGTNLIMTIIGCFMLLSFGTRGPVVGVILFLLLYILFVGNFKKKTLWFILLVLIGSLIWHFMDQIILFFYDFMPSIGMSNRIFEKVMANEFAGYENSSSRDVIIEKLWSGLQDNEYRAFGIGGTWLIAGGYAHNIFFDFIVSFGMLGGCILFGTLLFLLMRAFFACTTKDEKAFFCLLFVCGFFKLFLSNLYLSEPYFWILIGYSIYLLRYKRAQNASYEKA